MKIASIRHYIFYILVALLIIGIFIAILLSLKASVDLNPASKLNCNYYDSINITDGIHQNGDILYNNHTFSKDQYALVDTVLSFDAKRVGEFVRVAPYYRGCLCDRAGVKCVRLCCKEGCLSSGFENDFRNELRNRSLSTLVDNNFEFVTESCLEIGEIKTGPEPNITDDGILISGNKSFNHHEYCLYTRFFDKSPKISPKIPIVTCRHDEVQRAEKKLDIRRAIVPYLLFISVPFTVATFLVYLLIPELRNLHGKCLLCYLASLAVFQTFFGWIYINGETYVMNRSFCTLAGYITYYSVQSAFLWLSVISFDLWWNLQRSGSSKLSEKARFVLYSIYSWGISFILSLIILIMDNIEINKDYQPHMAHTICFLEPGFARRLIYFYLPQLILCSINVLFFILTALKIRQLQNEMAKIRSRDENVGLQHHTRLQLHKENFVLFLRLFIVMGVVWIMESVSFLVESKSIYFFVFDIWNCLQGVLIFIFMICKSRVFRLIKKRIQILMSNPDEPNAASNHTVTDAMAGVYENPVAMDEIHREEAYIEKNT